MIDYAKKLNNPGAKRNSFYGYQRQGGGVNFNLIVLLGLVVGIVVYVAQANSLVTLGLEVRDCQKELQQTRQAFQQLQVQATYLQSLPVLEAGVKDKELVDSKDVSYLASPINTVALGE